MTGASMFACSLMRIRDRTLCVDKCNYCNLLQLLCTVGFNGCVQRCSAYGHPHPFFWDGTDGIMVYNTSGARSRRFLRLNSESKRRY